MGNTTLNILIRVAVIIAMSIALVYTIVYTDMLFAPVSAGIVLLLTAINLVHYVNTANRDLARTLLSLRQGAFTDLSAEGKQNLQLNTALREIMQEFAKVSLERELHYQHLKALNEHANVAILTFDDKDRLIMMNPEAKKLLHIEPATLADIAQADPSLLAAIRDIRPGQRQTVKCFIDEQQVNVSVQTKEIVLDKRFVRIIFLQNITTELESREVEAWQQLTRVLTHEIMNSVTPIASLADAIGALITDADGSPRNLSQLDSENSKDIHSGVSTIAQRSRGLLRFVASYKEFAKNAELRSESLDAVALVKRVMHLLSPDIGNSGARVHAGFQRPQMITQGDTALLEQVVINIIRNALEAVPKDGTGTIDIDVRESSGTVAIAVADNGAGMDDDTLSRIFIPFYTTKTNGTGIGLSISRKIMRLHRGTIRVQSAPGEGSVFTITW